MSKRCMSGSSCYERDMDFRNPDDPFRKCFDDRIHEKFHLASILSFRRDEVDFSNWTLYHPNLRLDSLEGWANPCRRRNHHSVSGFSLSVAALFVEDHPERRVCVVLGVRPVACYCNDLVSAPIHRNAFNFVGIRKTCSSSSS